MSLIYAFYTLAKFEELKAIHIKTSPLVPSLNKD